MNAPLAADRPQESRPLRIFVVENHRDTLVYTVMYLEALGHTVQSAETMSGALAALPKADCDVLLSDIGLSDGDGWTLMLRLELPRPIYAIAMTGSGFGDGQRKSKEAGFRHHLLKPVDLKQLDDALAEAAQELIDTR